MKLLDFLVMLQQETAGLNLMAGEYSVVVEEEEQAAEVVMRVRVDTANGRLVIDV